MDTGRFSPEIRVAKTLRDRTGAPLVQCLAALRQAHGDQDHAAELMRLTQA